MEYWAVACNASARRSKGAYGRFRSRRSSRQIARPRDWISVTGRAKRHDDVLIWQQPTSSNMAAAADRSLSLLAPKCSKATLSIPLQMAHKSKSAQRLTRRGDSWRVSGLSKTFATQSATALALQLEGDSHPQADQSFLPPREDHSIRCHWSATKSRLPSFWNCFMRALPPTHSHDWIVP